MSGGSQNFWTFNIQWSTFHDVTYCQPCSFSIYNDLIQFFWIGFYLFLRSAPKSMLECHDKEIYKVLADAVLQLPLSALLEHFVDMQLPAPSSQDTLPVADPSWSSQEQPPSILSCQDTLPSEDPSWPYQGQPAPSSLSCQDTLPSEDPSWLYSRVQGQPAPIPPRNEPLLYIPNNVVDEEASWKICSPGFFLQPSKASWMVWGLTEQLLVTLARYPAFSRCV